MKKKTTPAVKRAAKHLRKGSGDAGLAMAERKEVLFLKRRVEKLQRKSTGRTTKRSSGRRTRRG